MATSPTVSENPEVQQHYAAQVALSAALVAALRQLWPTLDLADLSASLTPYKAAAVALVQRFSEASASLSLDHFEAMRADAGVTTPFRAPISDPPPAEQVDAVVDWATADLWDSSLLVTPATPPGERPASPLSQASSRATVAAPIARESAKQGAALDEIVAKVQQKIEGGAVKIVADAGRNELIEAIEADREARGFARVTKPGACAFCMMLATRGAVYKSRETAGAVTASTRLGDDARGEVNRYHNDCHCTVIPLFGHAYEAPAHVRAAEALWADVTKQRTGAAKAKAFRRAYEGRADGPERKAGPRGSSEPAQPAQAGGFKNLTRDQIEHQIGVLEGLKDTEYKRSTLAKYRKRLAQLS